MKSIEALLTELDPDNQLSLEEIPDLDLYMDQVIQLFEKKFGSTKRHEEEKVLTKTMINNYAKGKLFFPIKNKKYSKQHLILISLIYQLKGALSINDTKTILDGVNRKIVEEEFEIEKLYDSYLHLSSQNTERFTEAVQASENEVKAELHDLEDTDSEYLEQVLMIASLVNMSNMYRRLAEKLVDEIGGQKED